MPVADHILAYAVDLTTATRPAHAAAGKTAEIYIEWGAGPRASQYLILGAKAFALMDGRAAPEAADVRRVAPQVLAHRMLPTVEASMSGRTTEQALRQIVANVPMPESRRG